MTSQLNRIPSGTIEPHGGQLVNRILRGDMRQAAKERAISCFKLNLSPMNLSDLELIANGALSPLTGFMGLADYERVIKEMRLSNGTVWTLPITLAVDEETAVSLTPGQEIALCENGRVLALMELTEKYYYDKELEADLVYKTTNTNHPSVARLNEQGNILIAGDVWIVDLPQAAAEEFPQLRHTPAQTRRMFARRGWKRIVGFQSQTPIHRTHEYIQKTALELVDGLFIHPLVGETKKDELPADVRIASYQAILRDYYPPESVLLGVFPAAMRYAGPREAIFHAIIRQNYGCTHFIIGQDHAGFGDYYRPYDAQRIFKNFSREEIAIEIMPFDYTYYCKKCGTIVSAKTCPHGGDDWIYLSGKQVKEMIDRGEMLPPEFARPEVSKLLLDRMQALKQQDTPPVDEVS